MGMWGFGTSVAGLSSRDSCVTTGRTAGAMLTVTTIVVPCSELWSRVPNRAIVSCTSYVPQNDVGSCSYLGLYITYILAHLSCGFSYVLRLYDFEFFSDSLTARVGGPSGVKLRHSYTPGSIVTAGGFLTVQFNGSCTR